MLQSVIQPGRTKEKNILILGETGVGKSTWINCFTNYLYFADMEEAMNAKEFHVLIPSCFTFTQLGEEKTIKIGESDEMVPGTPATKEPQSYVFNVGGERIRLIDTPGIGDIGGITQDCTNFDNILSYLTYYEEIHAVCILLKPNDSRLSVVFRFCIQELLAHLHSSVKHNIVFCFTYARATFYEPGDTLPALNNLLRDMDVGIQATHHNYFCFDNSPFRILACIKNGVQFSQGDIDTYAESWDKSVEETIRLFHHINSLKPHQIRNTLNVNEARRIIVAMSKPLAQVAKTIQQNVHEGYNAKTQIDLDDKDMDRMKANLKFSGLDLQREELDYPRTVCTHSDCIKFVRIGATSQQMVICKQICHDHCYLAGIPTETINDARLQGCFCIQHDGTTCHRCGHHYTAHMHITYQLTEFPREFLSPEVQAQINEKKSAKETKEAFKRAIDTKIGELKEEKRTIIETSAKYGSFLKANALIPYNDAVGDYLEMSIIQERNKASAIRNNTLLSAMEDMKRLYEHERKILDKAIGSTAYDQNTYTLEEVKKLQDELFRLKHVGQTLKDLFSGISIAHSSRNIAFKEKTAPTPHMSMKKTNKRINEGSPSTIQSSNDYLDNESDSDGSNIPLGGHAVPFEILARGPRAQQAYKEAAQAGTKKIFRTRLMLVGQERVGKTSLKKSLTGQKFDKNEAITDGVETSNDCEISVEVAKTGGITWSIHREEHDKGNKYKKALAEDIAKKLTTKDPKSEEPEPNKNTVQKAHFIETHKDKTKEEASQVKTSQKEQALNKVAVSVEPESERQHWESRASVNPEQEEASHKFMASRIDDRMLTDLASEIVKSLKKQGHKKESGADDSDDKALSLSIWDFAGQDVYYTTHQVFLTWRAVYVIVFDLSKSLDSVVQPKYKHTGYGEAKGASKSELTCLEFINFWLCSIFAHAVAPDSVTTKCTGKPKQKCPPIFIVGTHRESIKGDKEEQMKKITSVFDAIRETIKKKPYECHVIPKYYAIENSLDDNDEQLNDLRKDIEKVAKDELYMGEKIPLKYLKFEEMLSPGKLKSMYMQLDEIEELTSPMGMETGDQLLTMLNFYHDLGYIVYYGGMVEHQSLLRDIVILNPQWLIDVFKQVITIQDPAKKYGIVSDSWTRLEDDGILEERLIQHMWQGFKEQKEALVELMAKFDLICEVPVHGNDAESSEVPEVVDKCYYVPSRLSSPFHDEEMAHIKSSIFYVDFKGFLPDGLFHRLMTRAVRWIKERDTQEVKLFHRHIRLTADEEHCTLLKMLAPNKAMIKVTVFRPDDVVSDEDDVSISQGPQAPAPHAVKEVMDFLKQTLESLRLHWVKRIKYDVCFPCPKPKCCKKIPFDKCIKKKSILCGTGLQVHRINIAEIKSKYGLEPCPPRKSDGEVNHPGKATEHLNLDVIHRKHIPTSRANISSGPVKQKGIDTMDSSSSSGPHEKIVSGKSDNFDDILVAIAKRTRQDAETDALGKALRIAIHEIDPAKVENRHGIDYMGTLHMLRAWRKGQRPSEEVGTLQAALRNANISLLSEVFPDAVTDVIRGCNRRYWPIPLIIITIILTVLTEIFWR